MRLLPDWPETHTKAAKFGARRRIAPFLKSLRKPDEHGPDAPDPDYDIDDTGLGGAAVFFAAQDQSCRTRLAHQRFEPGLDRPGDRRDLPADFSRRPALARDQRGMRRTARDETGNAVQCDRDLLQSDAAILDRRRRGAALAGGAQRFLLAGPRPFPFRR